MSTYRCQSTHASLALTTGVNLAILGNGFITSLLAARLLGPEGRGSLVLIQLWPMLAAALATLGLPEAMVYFRSKTPAQAPEYFGAAQVLGLASSGLFLVLGYGLMPLLLGHHTPGMQTAARFYLMIIPILVLSQIAVELFRGGNQIFMWNAFRPIMPLLWSLVLVYAWLTGIHDPFALAWRYLLGAAFYGGVVALVAAAEVRQAPRPSLESAGRLLRFGLPLLVANVPKFLNAKIDQVLIASLVGTREVGLYFSAVGWSTVIVPCLSGFGFVLFPKAARLEGLVEQRVLIEKFSRVFVLMAVPLTLLGMAVAPVALPLVFGEAFRPAVPPAIILTLACALAAFNRLQQDALSSLGKTSRVAKCEARTLVVTCAVTLLLLKLYGLWGAALGNLIGCLTGVFLYSSALNHSCAASLRNCLVPRWSDLNEVRGLVQHWWCDKIRPQAG